MICRLILCWLQPLILNHIRALPNLKHAHYIDIVVRRNGKDEIYEADWLKKLRRAFVKEEELK